jgi:hypothetical protein
MGRIVEYMHRSALRRYEMKSERSEMQGGKNWILPKEIKAPPPFPMSRSFSRGDN